MKEMKGGWFIGNFEPTAYKTEQFEVCYKHHTKGEKWDAHYHKAGTEINYLVSGKMTIQNKELNDLLKDNGFTVDSYFDYNKDFIRNLIQKSEENPNLMRQINLNLSVINDLILDLGKQLQEENPSFSIEQAERLASTNAEELIRSLNTANETINLKDNSSRTSKLIVESITKGKTIKIKGTKEQINLFNKLIKEELSIIQKIKNKKPYVVPTKDIELFEKLTGIKWPFKEEG